MSDGARKGPNRRWLEWEPMKPIITELPKNEPTEPTKPGFEGFVGSPMAARAEIDPEGSGFRGGDGGSALIHRESSVPSRVDCSTAAERVMSPYEWKAATLNQLFLEQGISGQPGRITAETVRDGERKQGRATRWPSADPKG
jgi:hypothetical protein